MSLTSNLSRVSTSFLLLAALCVTALGDTIRLKDGSLVKGKIVGFSGGRFTIAVGGTRKRQMTFSADEIESIVFDPSQDAVSIPTASSRTVKEEPIVEEDSQPIVVETKQNVPRQTATPTQVPVPVAVAVDTGRRVSFGKPIELSVKVMADNTANGWTNSGWVVKKGQKIRISGTGEVSIGRGKTTGPSGLYDLEDSSKLLKSVPTGALIAVIGDDNNEFIYIGAGREFTASRDGALFLGLNEGNLNDNSGSFAVKIEISPDGGE